MRRTALHVFWMGVKELRSFVRDPALVLFSLYAFTLYVATAGGGLSLEVKNATVGVVDEDRSATSRGILRALRPPQFRPPVLIDQRDIEPTLDGGDLTFVLHVPRDFEQNLEGGVPASLQLDVDATAVSQAALGALYIEEIVAREIGAPGSEASPSVRTRFNPNHESSWHVSLVELMFVVTLLSMVLPAASLLREREHGTVEHLLAMPLRPLELMLAKVWPNSIIVTVGAVLSLYAIVYGLFGAPARGSVLAFIGGTLLFQFTTAGLGILLATVARTVAQVALLSILVATPMLLLSGAWTPIESLPDGIRGLTVLSPLRYYAEFLFGVVLRGAPSALLWKQLLALVLLGAAFFLAGSLRFRARFAAG